MDEVVAQDVELEALDEKDHSAFWDARVQQYFDSMKTKELRLEAPPILAPTDDFTATVLDGGKDYSLKSIREGQGYAGPNDYKMQDLQTNRPVRLADFMQPGTRIRYDGAFYLDRYADLVDLSNPTVLYPRPDHSWDGDDNTHIGGTGTGDGGSAGNDSRWRSNIWSNHFLYMNLYDAGRTADSIVEVQRLLYKYEVKEYGYNTSYTSSEIYCKPSLSNSNKRAQYISRGSSPGYGNSHNTISSTQLTIIKSDGTIMGDRWHGGIGLSDAQTLQEIKEHISLGMLGAFSPLTAVVNNRCPYVSRVEIKLNFTVQY